jgi:hypothetical protein
MKFKYIAGFNDKASNYLFKNSPFEKGKHIGCKKSDGVLSVSAEMYKKEEICNKTVFLFKYLLKNGKYSYEEIQCIDNGILFLQIRKPNNNIIKWSKKEITNYQYEYKINKLKALIGRIERKIDELDSKKHR